MNRGPKIKTAENSRRGCQELIHHETLDPPCELSEEAEAEYWRLMEILSDRNTLSRVDLVCVAECARIKVLLDQAHAAQQSDGLDWQSAKLIGLLTTHHRGRLRELGLTTAPNRSVVRSTPKGSEREEKSKWAGNLKIG